MLPSVITRPSADGYEVYFKDEEMANRGFWHNEGSGNLPKREWMGLIKREVDDFFAKVVNAMRMVK
jgi:hypothetical protein